MLMHGVWYHAPRVTVPGGVAYGPLKWGPKGGTLLFSELHSDWVPSTLAQMDYAYERGELRNDIKSYVLLKPSEYWQRQCHLGTSLFSRSEIRHRHDIGLDKMMFGFDYPHFEGVWRLGVSEYLRRTPGAEQVPATEARIMLADTALEVYGFDRHEMDRLTDLIGPESIDLLGPPREVPDASIGSDIDRRSVFDTARLSAASAAPSLGGTVS
jgi:hypothetical protein